ncbi:MAG: hypothetical protein AB8G23_17320 [Myxococcota bacterium]
MAEPSLLLTGLFVALLLLTLGGALSGVARWSPKLDAASAAIALTLWLTATGALAQLGVMQNWQSFPPPAVLVFTTGLLATVLISRMRWAKAFAVNAPIAFLVGFQAFRLPLELIMHHAANEGVMPIQMSFSGQNFDILTGALAVVIGGLALVREVPRPLLWVFTGVGLGLLINIVTIAVRSMPVIAAYGPTQLNLWVTIVPFVWLPTIFVTLALFGHLLLIERLRKPPSAE